MDQPVRIKVIRRKLDLERFTAALLALAMERVDASVAPAPDEPLAAESAEESE